MRRPTNSQRPTARIAAGLGLPILLAAGGADAGGAQPFIDAALRHGERFARLASAWYDRTPPIDRMTWGGLLGCAALGSLVLFERMIRVRRRRVTPREFTGRFLDRLSQGKLDRGKALDLCELHPCPASRVALAAVKRWGRPVGDLERAAVLAAKLESDRLRRNVGTLRRVAALAPLIGLLGTLASAGRALAAAGPGTSWGPAVAAALGPLTAGVALAVLALLAYDGLTGRVEALVAALDRIGAETVDAIAMAAPSPTEPRAAEPRWTPGGPGAIRAPHQVRVEIPEPTARTKRQIELDVD